MKKQKMVKLWVKRVRPTQSYFSRKTPSFLIVLKHGIIYSKTNNESD